MATFGEAEKVVAFPGGVKRIGFVLDGPKDVNGEEKYSIQTGSEVHTMAYREVPNDEEGKTGGTFRKVNR